MTTKQKCLLFLAISFIVVQLVLLAPNTVEEWSTVENSSSKSPEQIMTDVKLYERRLNKNDWELIANKAEAISQDKDWMLFDVQIKFFGEEIQYIVKAKQAKIESTTSNMQIEGDVELQTSSGFTIYTKRMNYLSKKRHLYAPNRTKIISPKDKTGSHVEMEANQMTANIDLNQANVVGDVRTTKYSRSTPVKIASDEAVFHLDTRVAQFVNSVEVDYNTSKVISPLASLAYDPIRQQFTTMMMSGGAKLTDLNRVATADEMSIHFIEQKLKLAGSPRLIQDGDELIGEEIYLLNGGKRIKVLGAKAQIEDLQGK